MPSILGVVTVDLESNGLGLRSRLAERFAGATILEHTLRRLQRGQAVTGWLISCPATQLERVRVLVGSKWPVEPIQTSEPSWRAMARRGRKWSLDGWRGGVGRTCVFDEADNPRELARLARMHRADWVVVVRGESPLVDPSLVDGLVQRTIAAANRPPLMYGPIPPGLAGWVYRPDFLEELAEKQLHPGYVLGYKSWDPTIDLTEQLFSFKPPLQVARLSARFIADNDRSMALLRRYEARAEQIDAVSLAESLAADSEWRVGAAPAEIEIEATTRRSIGHRHHPQVSRPDLSMDDWGRIVEDYARASDVARITLGGQGDPLLHPEWSDLLVVAHGAGIYGLALTTDGVALDDATIDRLLGSELDILHVRLDAHCAATYLALHDADRFEAVSGKLLRFVDRRRAAGQAHPLLVVSMVRCQATLGEMGDFYDHWSSHADAALIAQHSDYAGQLPADPVLNLEPPGRAPCRRLSDRMMVHSDGAVVSCSEDFAARQVVGHIREGIMELWRKGPLAELRNAHRAGRWSDQPLCGHCREWHRP